MWQVIVSPWRPRSRVSLGVNSKEGTFQSDPSPGLGRRLRCIELGHWPCTPRTSDTRVWGPEPRLDDAASLEQSVPVLGGPQPGPHQGAPGPLLLAVLAGPGARGQVVDVTEFLSIGFVQRVRERGAEITFSDM